MEEKRCSVCKELKPHSEYHAHKGSKDGLQLHCKVCALRMARDRRRNNPDVDRATTLWRRYKLTIDGYETLLAIQGGRCAICGTKPGKTRLAVDHNHLCCPGRNSCGNCIRGLLCGTCNRRVLGGAERTYKDPARADIVLTAAIKYRNNPPAKGVINGRETVDSLSA